MLLHLAHKELIPQVRERLTFLGVEHHLLAKDGAPVFEINSELSIFSAKELSAQIRDLGRVEHNGARTPLLDDLQPNHTVEVAFRGGEKIVFRNNPERPVWIAGPCSLDERDNLRAVAAVLSAAGVRMLRGGAVKPRTSPHEFQGVGLSGYRMLAETAHEFGMAAISEALSEHDVDQACEFLDMIQIGARNMQNFPLLKRLGRVNKPLLLKRGPGSTLREWASAAEYLVAEGNKNIVLCERGVRGLERELRYTLDLAGASFMQQRYKLPVVIDPSHATGVKQVLESCTAGALAMGFAGVMLEAHPCPSQARSDSLQALSLDAFGALAAKLLHR
jgi:3-deoxy-7-phosphoheptulonate synthase